MKTVEIEIVPAIPDVEASIRAYDADGRPMTPPARIVISPYFYRADQVVNVAHARVLVTNDADEAENPGESVEVHQALLQLPGASGRLRMQSQSAVQPRFVEALCGGEELPLDDETLADDEATYEDD